MTDAEQLHARRWWTLAVLCLSLLIVFVGNSSLNVVIPTLSRELHASNSQLQWAVAGYSLVFAGLLFSAGSIGDRFGRKGALQFGLLGFLGAVVLASLSTAMWEIILCRALMGAAAAFIMPSTLSILVNVFGPEERTKAIAIWAGVSGGAGVIGPVGSGWLLSHFWYGSVFLVNVPIILLALVAGVSLVPHSKDPVQSRLDPVGAGLSIVGISSLVLGLISAPSNGWTSPSTLGSFVLGLGVMAAFVFYERRIDEPMLDMSFFRNSAFSVATGGMILVFMSMFGVMFLITQYFQLVLNFSPLSSALRFLPMAPIMMIIAPLTPKLSARLGANRAVALGMALISVAFLGYTQLRVDTGYPEVLAFMVVLVSGMALTMSPMTAAIMSAVPPRRAGAGSAMNDATRELGSALGVAVLGSVAASRYSSGIAKAIAHLSPADQSSARSSLAEAVETAKNLPHALGDRLTADAAHAFVSGIHIASFAGAILAAIAAALVWRFLPTEVLQHAGAHGALEDFEEAENYLSSTLLT